MAKKTSGLSVDLLSTLIAVADDCPVKKATVPAPRGGKPTLPQLQYEMLKDHPYEFTSAEVIFETTLKHKGITPAEMKKYRKELWEHFYSKPRPCLRTSALAKTYGWGFHCDAKGRVALCAVESKEYKRLLAAKTVQVVKAMRSKRGS